MLAKVLDSRTFADKRPSRTSAVVSVAINDVRSMLERMTWLQVASGTIHAPLRERAALEHLAYASVRGRM
jgi:hypothetical protein